MPALSIREALQLVLDCPDCGGSGSRRLPQPRSDEYVSEECVCRSQARDALEAPSDERAVERLHSALDRASDLAIQLDVIATVTHAATRNVARALVDLMDRVEYNSAEARR